MSDNINVADVPCNAGRKLHFCWGLGSQLLICDLMSGPIVSEQPSTVTTFQWGFPGPLRRRVIYDSFPKYKQLQEHEGELQQEIVESYSSTISQVLEASLSSTADNDFHGEGDIAEADLLAAEKAVWDAVHIFFVTQGRAQGSVTEELVQWLHNNARVLCSGPTPADIRREVDQHVTPEDEATYWNYLLRSVALGWLEGARVMLGEHTAWARWDAQQSNKQLLSQINVLEPVSHLLRLMPRLPGGSGSGPVYHSMNDYLQYRRKWQTECQRVLHDEDLWRVCHAVSPATADGCRSLLEVMCGEAAQQEERMSEVCQNWLELFVSKLLHQYPTINLQVELVQLVSSCCKALPPSSSQVFLHHMAEMLPLAAALDVQGLSSRCSSVFGDWLMCHVMDVLMSHHSSRGVLDAPLKHIGGDQVEYYALEYAAALMPINTCWKIAAGYLECCPTHGQAALAMLLQHLPVAESALLQYDAVATAQQYDMAPLAAGLWRAVGVSEWQAGRLATAASWLMMAHDDRRAQVVLQPVVQLCEDAIINGMPPGSDIPELQSLSSLLSSCNDGKPAFGAGGVTSSHPLSFLHGCHALCAALQRVEEAYKEPHTNQQQLTSAHRAVKSAAMQLMRCGSTNPHLMLPLTLLITPCLDADGPPTVSHSDTHAIIAALQSSMGVPCLRNAPDAVAKTVQLALAKNLARTHIIETQSLGGTLHGS